MFRKFTSIVSLCLLMVGFSHKVSAVDIEILFVYPPEIKKDYPNLTSIQDNFINNGNAIFQLNLMDVRLRSVVSGGKQVNVYGDNHTVNDPKIFVDDAGLVNNVALSKEIFALRNAEKPDVVVYLGAEKVRNGLLTSGVAILPSESTGLLVPSWATTDAAKQELPKIAKEFTSDEGVLYASMTISTVADSTIFLHELGHVLGAGHGIEGLVETGGYSLPIRSPGSPITTSIGWGVKGTLVTVMGHQPFYVDKSTNTAPVRVEAFSSPTTTCGTYVCGTDYNNANDGVELVANLVSQYSSCYPMTIENREAKCNGYPKTCAELGVGGQFVSSYRRWESGSSDRRAAAKQCGVCGYYKRRSGSSYKLYCKYP